MREEGMERHSEVYREEAFELLAELESALLELEEHPHDADLISRVFRAMHTIKGSGSMFGFEEIAEFTHDVENVFDLIRNGKMFVTKELIDLTLAARDQIRRMLALPGTPEAASVDEAESRRIIGGLRALVPESIVLEERAAIEARRREEMGDDFAPSVTYRIRFVPPRDIFLRGVNPALILNDLRMLGKTFVVAHTNELPSLGEMDPEMCYTYWDIILTTSEGIDAVRDAFIFVEDESQITIDIVDEGGALVDDGDYKKLGEILVERGDITVGDMEKLLIGRPRLGELLVEAGLVGEESIEAALSEQKHIKGLRMERFTREQASTIRVASEKLDKLVDLVGELVTVQARLTQYSADRRSDAEVVSIAEEVERLTSELHDNTMSIRMVPIGTTFSKFRRLVRDLSNELGREVLMSTSGGDTELDKTVIERLNDPLVHIIRNSLDHGIEPPEVREAAGKPRQGSIHLSARHSGHNVIIDIVDDGAGLDRASIRERALDMGLIDAAENLSDAELYTLIFAPGFSTARTVTGVSGRGVGMDVVRQGLEGLRGSVDVKSRKGLGTTVSLTIPLTLAIVEGLLVMISGNFFVLPLSVVEECVELSTVDRKRAHGRHLVNVRGEMVPYLNLREQFSLNGNPPELQQVVVLRTEGFRVGFLVDQVIGGHQTVIKTLGRVYRDVQGISGATILGDGTVALILDVPKLVQGAELEESEAVRGGGLAKPSAETPAQEPSDT
jgi:two-component system chemotaxis sensor kinase CheA